MLHMSGNNKVITPLAERLKRRLRLKEATGCMEWQGWRHPKGPGQIGRGTRAEGLAYTHVVAWELANGRRVPEGMVVCHRCDNPPCCNPDHLFIGTRKDNTQDMLRKKRHVFGERAAKKLRESDVIDIKAMKLAGHTQQEIADKYGVARSLVGLIVNGKRWSHVTE